MGVNKVELELEQAIRLLQAASVGKLIGGLIHNINGPLHTLGMEMDVMGFLLNKSSDPNPDILKDFTKRLSRMGEEFEKLNSMIRQAADRADTYSALPSAYLNINHLLREELEFLKANLYFKHHVETVMDLEKDMKSLSPRTEHLNLGFRWFLQALIEDLESNKISKLSLKTRAGAKHSNLTVRTEGGSLSSTFLASIQYEAGPGPISSTELGSLETLLAVSILKSSGVTVDHQSFSSGSEIRLAFPYE